MRTIPIPEWLIEQLVSSLSAPTEATGLRPVGTDRMFVSPTGKLMYDHTSGASSATHGRSSPTCREFRPYDLRHTHASLLIDLDAHPNNHQRTHGPQRDRRHRERLRPPILRSTRLAPPLPTGHRPLTRTSAVATQEDRRPARSAKASSSASTWFAAYLRLRRPPVISCNAPISTSSVIAASAPIAETSSSPWTSALSSTGCRKTTSTARQTVAWRRLVIASLHAARIAKIADELTPVDDAVEACFCETFDDRLGVTCPVRRERVEVPVGVGEQSGGDRHGHLTGESLSSQQAVHDRPPRSTVAIGKRMDRLELRVSDRCLQQHRQVVTVHEADEVVDRRRDPRVVRRDEACGVGPVAARADPDLRAAPRAGDLRIVVFEKSGVHGEDRWRVKPIGERDRRGHRCRVGDDLSGVAPRGVPELCLCDRLRGRCQVLDARRRRGFRTQQDRPERGDLGPHLGIEASELGGGLIGKRRGRCGQNGIQPTNRGDDRSPVRTREGRLPSAGYVERADPRMLLVVDRRPAGRRGRIVISLAP